MIASLTDLISKWINQKQGWRRRVGGKRHLDDNVDFYTLFEDKLKEQPLYHTQEYKIAKEVGNRIKGALKAMRDKCDALSVNNNDKKWCKHIIDDMMYCLGFPDLKTV